MPVNFHYYSERGYQICQTNDSSTILVKKLKLHEETDKVERGKAYMAFTEYDKGTYTGTVAFKDATIIEALKEDKEKSNHLFLYEMFHGANPRPGSDLIITVSGSKNKYENLKHAIQKCFHLNQDLNAEYLQTNPEI